jgi:hypothetical protein
MRKDILDRKDEIIKMIDDKEPKSKICRLLDCRPSTLETYLKKLGIEYKGNPGMSGKKTDPKRKSAIEYMEKEIVVTSKLRLKLIEDGLKDKKCEKCGISNWQGEDLPLELHHIDGNRFNNNIDNLQILCPNCHSLTPNHSKKKIENTLTSKINTYL